MKHCSVRSTRCTKPSRWPHQPNPPRKRGDWCRFAPCRATCRLWTGPLLDLTAIGRPPQTPTASNADWGIFLANAKRLVDSALQYQKEIDAALMEHLKGGGIAPGFALKQQVKNRKWLDDADLVAAQLKKLGLSDDKIWQKKLQTFPSGRCGGEKAARHRPR